MIVNHTCPPHRSMIVYPHDIRHKLYDINTLDNGRHHRNTIQTKSNVISRSLSNLIISGLYRDDYDIHLDLIDIGKSLLSKDPRINVRIYCLIKWFTLLINLPNYKYDL